jgi:heptosyltransferase-2
MDMWKVFQVKRCWEARLRMAIGGSSDIFQGMDDISGIIGEVPRLPRVELELSDWRDGLIVRVPNWLGDACMAFPALSVLRRLLPVECGLFVVCPPSLGALFESLAGVDAVVALSGAHKAWSSRDFRAVSKLNAGVGLLLNNSLRDAIHFRMSRVPRLYGMAARGRSIFLTRAFRVPKKGKGGVGGTRHAARYLALAEALGAPSWDGVPPHVSSAKEKEILAVGVSAALAAPRLLAVAPGAAYGPSKRWPAAKFNDICRRWVDSGGTVAVLGAPGEEGAASETARGLPGDSVFDFSGKTDLGDVVEILRSATAVVANDSGIMHLSAVLGGRGVAVFGSTDPGATPPVSEKWRLLSAGLDCSPCFERRCPSGGYACLEAITPDMVWEALDSILKED